MEPVGSRAYSTNTLESGLDPLAAAGHLHRRGTASLPRVARRRQLRGDQRHRRQLRVRRHRGLLHQPVGPRLRLLRQVRPRLHRPGRPRGPGQGRAAPQGHPGVELRRPRQAARRSPVEGREVPVLRPAERQLRVVELRQGHRRRRHPAGRVDVHRHLGEREEGAVAGHHQPRRPARRRGHAWSGASPTAAARRPPSSRTSSSRSAPPSARSPTPRWRGRPTTPGGAAPATRP